MTTAVEVRSYSPASGSTSTDAVTAISGKACEKMRAADALVLGVPVGIEKADRDRLDAFGTKERTGRQHAIGVYRRSLMVPSASVRSATSSR